MMNKYETVFIINPSNSEEEIKGLVTKFKDLLEKSAQLENIEEWGIRKLAYPINKKEEGYYVLASFSSDTAFPHELERVFKITDGIIKHMIIRKDERVKGEEVC